MAKTVTIATFNVENLFMRYKIFGYYPGKMGNILNKKQLEEQGGFLPNQKWKNSFKVFDDGWRDLTAAVILDNDTGKIPDILCLQEVENMDALRRFNEDFLGKHYKYAYLMDAKDPRRIDVGVLSNFPMKNMKTHIYDLYEGDLVKNREFVFSRDCLEITFEISKKQELTVFVNHLKSKYAKTQKDSIRGDLVREVQAREIVKIIKKRFKKNFNSANFVVVGDFNDQPNSTPLKPLLNMKVDGKKVENVVSRLPEDERWTHWWAKYNVVSQIDFILLSPKLTRNSTGKPYIERGGIEEGAKNTWLGARKKDGGKKIPFEFIRFEGVTDKISASDHAMVMFDLKI